MKLSTLQSKADFPFIKQQLDKKGLRMQAFFSIIRHIKQNTSTSISGANLLIKKDFIKQKNHISHLTLIGSIISIAPLLPLHIN